jgi:hypothetical protein
MEYGRGSLEFLSRTTEYPLTMRLRKSGVHNQTHCMMQAAHNFTK